MHMTPLLLNLPLMSGCPVQRGSTPTRARVLGTPRVSGRAAGVYYHDYLQLDRILGAQLPESARHGDPAHEEMLFIIVHQTYELWFKQILHELESCVELFSRPVLPESQQLLISSRLHRVTEIQRILVDQIRVLETMSPMDFLDFRGYLFPASGFQSVQFRKVENVLGLRRGDRIKYQKAEYCSVLRQEHEDEVSALEKRPSLHDLVEKWLERTPFLETDDFSFWDRYKEVVQEQLRMEREGPENMVLTAEEKVELDASAASMEQRFASVFDEDIHNELVRQGKRKMSNRAWQAMIFIFLYRDIPVLQMPYQILNRLLDIDGLLTNWRLGHAQMVHRMLGLKSGTGGSSGVRYLKATAQHHTCFPDLKDASEYLLPRSLLPRIPQSLLDAFSSRLHE